jgi:hypothetical protein
MSVNFKIPLQSRFITTSNKFSSAFNSTPGGYSFTLTPGCTNVFMMDLQPNTTYLINSVSVGANISEEQYLESIRDFPNLYVKRELNNIIVYQQPIAISRFFDGNEASAWIYSDQGRDRLLLTLSGALNQLASMIGIDPVILEITFNIFAIDSGYFNSAFRDEQSITIGQSNRR